MDPISILALTDTCLSITFRLGKAGKNLYTLSQKYKSADYTIRLLQTYASAIEAAVRGIEQWLRGPAAKHSVLREHLEHNLSACDDLVRQIDEHLAQAVGDPGKKNSFWSRTKYVWNDATVTRYEGQMRNQVQALGLLLQVMQL